MDVLGTAVGIASLGIQICQSLLTYYDGWKAYESDIAATYESIMELSRTLMTLKASLEGEELDKERVERVKSCLQSCETALTKLSEKAQKLRKHGQPEGLSQRAWSELQRLQYPFRASTLMKLREIVSDVQSRLQLAIQVLHLDASKRSQKLLVVLDKRTSSIESRIQTMQQSDQFKNIIDWLDPSDPQTNHSSARQKCEPQTGAWLLKSDVYQDWKLGPTKRIWLFGKPGCGKTVLCSTAIEDIRKYCADSPNAGLAAFYFTFSDKRKQTDDDLFRSLLAQLGWKEPALSILQQAYERPNQKVIGTDDIQTILTSSINSFDVMFLMLDALDESPEESDVRYGVLERLERLVKDAPNLKLLITSRDVRDVRESMETANAQCVSIATSAVNADIRRYVTTQLAHDRRFHRLDLKTTVLIKKTISEKADGMFRWAYCQLLELKKLKSTKPKYIEDALRTLPSTLDETYERMLSRIDQRYVAEALTLLNWLAYAQSPPSLAELAEAAIVNPEADEAVDTRNRGHWEDTLDILSGLVTIQSREDDEDDSHSSDDERDAWSESVDLSSSICQVTSESRIRLAHFSVKEYLESSRILEGQAKQFHLLGDSGHRLLAQSCLAYIMHYSASIFKRLTIQDVITFPLLEYSTKTWFRHSSQQLSPDVKPELALLKSETAKLDWLRLDNPEWSTNQAFDFESGACASGLYYAAFLGLDRVVQVLLDDGIEVNAQGGGYGNALQAASFQGHEKVVQMLLDSGAEVNARGGYYDTALQAASDRGHEKVVQMLLDRGTEVNARGGHYDTALQAASDRGYEKVVQMLLDRGAEVNVRGGHYDTAPQAASDRGHKKVVQMLLDRGAEVNAQEGGCANALHIASYQAHERVVQMQLNRGVEVKLRERYHDTALQAASDRGHEKVVQMLLDRGAEVNTQRGGYANALHIASFWGHERVVQLLLDRGAEVNACRGDSGTALYAASHEGYEKVVQILLDRGAEINARGGYYDTALQAASDRDHEKVVQMLLDRGAEVNAQGGYYGNALQAASFEGHKMVVQMLLDRGAEVNARRGAFRTALHVASDRGHEKVVQMLLDRGAEMDVRGGHYDAALLAALNRGHEKMVQLLLDRGAEVDAWGGHCDTALQAASNRGHEKVVQMLLDCGADINARGGYYDTALQAASERGHEKVVQMLLDRGAEVNAQGGAYGSALKAASDQGHKKVVQILLDGGAAN